MKVNAAGKATSMATVSGFESIQKAIRTRAKNTDLIEQLQEANASQAVVALDAAKAVGYTPNALKGSADLGINVGIVAAYRAEYGEGFTCYGSHGKGKIKFATLSDWQKNVVKWFKSLPCEVGKAFTVARATK